MINNVLNMSKNRKIDYINNEIFKLENYLKKPISDKKAIRDKAIFYKLKILAIQSKYYFMHDIQNFLVDESIYNVYKSIDYLKVINKKSFNNDKKKEYLFTLALLNEIVENYDNANEIYKELIELDDKFKKERSKFQNRVVELKRKNLKQLNKRCEETDKPEILENQVKTIEKMAKSYLKSINSHIIAKKYFLKVIDIYKKLYSMESDKYYNNYVLTLIKAVEIYELDKEYLYEAEKIVFHSNKSPEINKYFLNKIFQLKLKK